MKELLDVTPQLPLNQTYQHPITPYSETVPVSIYQQCIWLSKNESIPGMVGMPHCTAVIDLVRLVARATGPDSQVFSTFVLLSWALLFETA